MAGAVDLSALKQRAQQNQAGADPGTGGGSAVELTDANFEAEVLVRSDQVPVVVLLWSPRSDASVQLAESLGEMASADRGEWHFTAVNVDVAPRLGQMFGIQGVPTVVAVAGGQPIASFEGPQPPEQLRRWILSLLSATRGKLGGAAEADEEAPVDPGLAQARNLLDGGNFDAALGAYQAILDKDPAHSEAKAAVRQIAFLSRATKHRHDAVDVAARTPDDIDAAFAAADVEILGQQVDAAFARLVALVRRTSGDDRTTVRTRLIELFDLFDPAEPEVIAARRNLANALY